MKVAFALATLCFASAAAPQDSKPTPATAPASQPAAGGKTLVIRVFQTGDPKKPVWGIAADNVMFGSLQLQEWTQQKSNEYKKDVQGNPAALICEQPVLIDADAGAPFGYIHTVLECLVRARFYKFEFHDPAGNVVQWIPREDEMATQKRHLVLELALNFIQGRGIVRVMGRQECKTEDDQVNAAYQLWLRETGADKKSEKKPEANQKNVVGLYIGSGAVRWGDVMSLMKQIKAKGMDEIAFELPDNDVVIPPQPRDKK